MMSILKQLSLHPTFCHADEMNHLCKPLTAFGISSFANARVNTRGEFSTVCNRPDYMRHYLEKKHHQADISAKPVSFDAGQYVMWDMLECQGQTADMLRDANSFDYKHIFTMIKLSETHTNYYHFGTHLNTTSINQWYLNNLDKLDLFIRYFDAHLENSKSLSQGHDICFPIASEECQIDWMNRCAEDFSEELILTQFSKRQLECLRLLVSGLTAKEIGQALNLSHRTVEDYLSICKIKLKAKNKTDLIAKIMRFIS